MTVPGAVPMASMRVSVIGAVNTPEKGYGKVTVSKTVPVKIGEPVEKVAVVTIVERSVVSLVNVTCVVNVVVTTEVTG